MWHCRAENKITFFNLFSKVNFPSFFFFFLFSCWTFDLENKKTNVKEIASTVAPVKPPLRRNINEPAIPVNLKEQSQALADGFNPNNKHSVAESKSSEQPKTIHSSQLSTKSSHTSKKTKHTVPNTSSKSSKSQKSLRSFNTPLPPSNPSQLFSVPQHYYTPVPTNELLAQQPAATPTTQIEQKLSQCFDDQVAMDKQRTEAQTLFTPSEHGSTTGSTITRIPKGPIPPGPPPRTRRHRTHSDYHYPYFSSTPRHPQQQSYFLINNGPEAPYTPISQRTSRTPTPATARSSTPEAQSFAPLTAENTVNCVLNIYYSTFFFFNFITLPPLSYKAKLETRYNTPWGKNF